MKKRKRITLEPELEAAAGHLGAFDRLMLARKLRRWVHQLEFSARILALPPSKRTRPPRLTANRAKWN
jgi:hypothetical protein